MTQLLAIGYNPWEVQSKVNALVAKGERLVVVETCGKKEEKVTSVRLTYAGVTLPEEHVVMLLNLAEAYRILPSLLIVILYFEGLRGQSAAANE